MGQAKSATEGTRGEESSEGKRKRGTARGGQGDGPAGAGLRAGRQGTERRIKEEADDRGGRDSRGHPTSASRRGSVSCHPCPLQGGWSRAVPRQTTGAGDESRLPWDYAWARDLFCPPQLQHSRCPNCTPQLLSVAGGACMSGCPLSLRGERRPPPKGGPSQPALAPGAFSTPGQALQGIAPRLCCPHSCLSREGLRAQVLGRDSKTAVFTARHGWVCLCCHDNSVACLRFAPTHTRCTS